MSTCQLTRSDSGYANLVRDKQFMCPGNHGPNPASDELLDTLLRVTPTMALHSAENGLSCAKSLYNLTHIYIYIFGG